MHYGRYAMIFNGVSARPSRLTFPAVLGVAFTNAEAPKAAPHDHNRLKSCVIRPMEPSASFLFGHLEWERRGVMTIIIRNMRTHERPVPSHCEHESLIILDREFLNDIARQLRTGFRISTPTGEHVHQFGDVSFVESQSR